MLTFFINRLAFKNLYIRLLAPNIRHTFKANFYSFRILQFFPSVLPQETKPITRQYQLNEPYIVYILNRAAYSFRGALCPFASTENSQEKLQI